MKYKTNKNLELVWKQLDDACGSLDNALINIASMKGIPKEIIKSSELIDFSQIVGLKNDVEDLIEKKKEKVNVARKTNGGIVTIGSFWKCIDEDSEEFNKYCVVKCYDNNPDFNGDGTIELLYSDHTLYTGKVRRFSPGYTHEFIKKGLE